MGRDWESWLETASGPASATEEADRDRTEARIRRAISDHPGIPSAVRVYAKGSYANGTNVRRDADVDVAVEWTNTQKVQTWGATAGLTPRELGYEPVSEPMTPVKFRGLVEEALISSFGSSPVDTSQDKHVGVDATSTTLEADVVPCFALARYDRPGDFVEGVRIYPKSGASPIENFPVQHKALGIEKNTTTHRRYKANVRCLKRLLRELYENGTVDQIYPGYLSESLVFNVPNPRIIGSNRVEILRSILGYLWVQLRDDDAPCMDWVEPNELLHLFRGHPDRIPKNALKMVDAAWEAIGIGN